MRPAERIGNVDTRAARRGGWAGGSGVVVGWVGQGTDLKVGERVLRAACGQMLVLWLEF